MKSSSSNRIAVVLLVFAWLYWTTAILTTGQTSGGEDKRGRQYKARVQEQLPNCLDTLVHEFDQLDDRYALSTRVDIAERLLQLLARQQPATVRKLLNRIFVESVDALKKEKERSEKPRQTGSPNQRQSATATIRRIIRIAARVDPTLGKTYLKSFLETERELAGGEQTPSEYFKLGAETVEANPSFAYDIGLDALKQVPKLDTDVLGFLYQLSKKDAKLADRFLLAVLNAIKAQRGRDINQLLLIDSYVEGVNVVPVVSAKGLDFFNSPYKPIFESSTVQPSTATIFLRAASELLLDSSRYSSNLEPPVWGMEGDLIALRMLEPQVSTLLPELMAPLARRLAFLASSLAEEKKSLIESDIEKLRRATETDRNAGNSTEDYESLLGRADKTTGSDKRDALYYEAVNVAVEKGEYTAALEICEKLSEPLRGQVKDFMILTIARAKLKQGSADAARDMARQIADVTQRTYLLTLIAQSSLNSGRAKGVFLENIFSDIESSVQDIKDTTERVFVLSGIGNVYSGIDQNKSFGYLQDAIVQANTGQVYSGGVSVDRVLKVGGMFFSYSLYNEPELSLSRLVLRHSQRDFFATLSLIDNLKNPLLRIRERMELYRGATSARIE